MYVVVLRWMSKRRLGRIALVRFTFLAVTRGAGSWPGQRGIIVRMVALATSWPDGSCVQVALGGEKNAALVDNVELI